MRMRRIRRNEGKLGAMVRLALREEGELNRVSYTTTTRPLVSEKPPFMHVAVNF